MAVEKPLLGELCGQPLHGAFDCAAQSPQSLGDWNQAARAKRAERYLNGDAVLHVHWSECGGLERWCAVFSGAERQSVEPGRGGAERDSVLRSYRILHNDQLMVLIGDVEVVNDPKQMVAPAVSRLIGLQREDECLGGGAHALYASLVTGNRLLLFDWVANGIRITQEERESRVVGLPAVSKNELPRELIQTGSKVVNALGGEDAQARRDGPSEMLVKELLNGVVILFCDKAVSVWAKDQGNFRLDVADVLLGPV